MGTGGVIKWPPSDPNHNPGVHSVKANPLTRSKHRQLSFFGKDFRTLQSSTVVASHLEPVGAYFKLFSRRPVLATARGVCHGLLSRVEARGCKWHRQSKSG